MKEHFLHYLWKYQKFITTQFVGVDGEQIQVSKPGILNVHQGPDFLMAQMVIDGQQWAGTVEIHVKSSHWYQHHHEVDSNYDSVILHVVWEHDVAIFRKDHSVIPTLEIASLVAPNILKNYTLLQIPSTSFLVCKDHLGAVPDMIFEQWIDGLFVHRMNQKSLEIMKRLTQTANHWEAVLLEHLISGFGLHINASAFKSIVQSVPFAVIQKCSEDPLQLEALLMGQAGLLDASGIDAYYLKLQSQYHYLRSKYRLENKTVQSPSFFRLRPASFPTLRLSQFANLWSQKRKLFTALMQVTTKEQVYELLSIKASDYWDIHYNFGVTSSKSKKQLSKSFMDLLIVNTIVPLQFTYQKKHHSVSENNYLELALSLIAEKNTIVGEFQKYRSIQNTAFHSQALLHLKKEYCDLKMCPSCAIGCHILSR